MLCNGITYGNYGYYTWMDGRMIIRPYGVDDVDLKFGNGVDVKLPHRITFTASS